MDRSFAQCGFRREACPPGGRDPRGSVHAADSPPSAMGRRGCSALSPRGGPRQGPCWSHTVALMLIATYTLIESDGWDVVKKIKETMCVEKNEPDPNTKSR